MRLPVSSLQLARSVHGAVLLVNGRSRFESGHRLPRSERISTFSVSRFVERMTRAGSVHAAMPRVT